VKESGSYCAVVETADGNGGQLPLRIFHRKIPGPKVTDLAAGLDAPAGVGRDWELLATLHVGTYSTDEVLTALTHRSACSIGHVTVAAIGHWFLVSFSNFSLT
jgi:hypothetical protein